MRWRREEKKGQWGGKGRKEGFGGRGGKWWW